MARLLDDDKHNPTEVEDVVAKLQADDKAFYDEKTGIREVPIFGYDPETGFPVSVLRWQRRRVIENDGSLSRKQLLERCAIEGRDTYIDGVGWVRNGKKREKDPQNPDMPGRK